MFDSFTVYLGMGLIAGLAGFLLLFRKYDFPSYLKKRFRLNTRSIVIGFALALGMAIALAGAIILNALSLSPVPAQILEGILIGLNCAILAGLVRTQSVGGSSGTSGRKQNKQQDKSGRRSKG